MRLRSLVAAALCLALVALLPLNASEAEPTHVMNVGTAAPDGTPWARQLQDFRARVEAESQGAVKVRAFLGGTMGSEIEMVRDIRRGERLQGGGIAAGAVAEGAGVPLLMMTELPYLFRSDAEADAVMDEVLFQPAADALAAKGFVLGFWALNGWRSFATKGGPATTPSELARYKMRAQESKVHADMYAALGTQSVAKPVSEVLPAINTGIVDGFDNTPLFSLAAGWMAGMTHYTLSRHIYQPAAVVFSKKWFDGLPPALQMVVMGDPAAEARKGREGVRRLEEELVQTIRDTGVTVVELTPQQRQVFADATRTVHTTFLADHPELKPVYERVQGKLAAMR